MLKDFADWEGAYIAPNLNVGVESGSESRYIVKTAPVRKEPVISTGGFKVPPDYGINDIPVDYARIVLIGSMDWFTPKAEAIVSLVEKAIEKRRLVAGICNASVFLGRHGFLNHVDHTGNGLDHLKQFAGPNYAGENLYINEPAARAGNIITANGFTTLEFCREIPCALEADSSSKIERSYRMNKTGVWEDPEVGQTTYLMVVDNKNIYHQQLTSIIICYFSTTKYNRPLLANRALSPIFFKKRPKTEILFVGSLTPLFFCSDR